MMKESIICRDCVHWDAGEDREVARTAPCTLASRREPQPPMIPVAIGPIPGGEQSLTLVTRADFGCNAAISRYPEDNEDLWKERIPRIRQAVAERTPEFSQRVNNLAHLLSYLEDYHQAVLASITGYDPDDPERPDFESTFGDSTMEEMIGLIRSLPTIPARIEIPAKSNASEDATPPTEE